MKMASAFFCSTPYQLIAAMSIVKDSNEKSDLYILTQFKDSESYANRIRKTKLFSRVRLIDDEYIKSLIVKNKIINRLHLGIILSFLFVDRIMKKILFEQTEYKKVYFSSKAYILQLVEFYFEKKNSVTEKIYFDDGIGTYSTFSLINSLRKRDYCIKKILSPHWKALRSDKLYVYSPDVYRSINKESKYKIIKINNICNSDINCVNYVFGSNQSRKIHEPIIILDTIGTEVFDEENLQKYNKIIDDIITIFGNNNVIIKRHPRDSSEKNANYHYYENDSIPFEIVIANSDFNNKILISFFSTAVITPKLLFDQEPQVLLLNSILKSKISVNKEVQNCFEEISKLYEDKHRFIVPKNGIELRESIKSLKKW